MIDSLIMKNLLLEVLDDKLYINIGAHKSNLFKSVEEIAIKYKFIDHKHKIPEMAWGTEGVNPIGNHNTNFNKHEIEIFWESFNWLLNNNIIGPGMHRTSSELPYFHITDHGKECIKRREILPYDADNYLKKLKNIEGLDSWVEFYVQEALRCYSASCYNAATIMIGLSSEVLVERMFTELFLLLGDSKYKFEVKKEFKINNKPVKQFFEDKKKKSYKITQKYNLINIMFDNVINLPINITNKMIDKSARDTFATFIRLNRNEVSHCNEVKKDPTETLLLFLGFVKYCELMTNLINEIKNSISEIESV